MDERGKIEVSGSPCQNIEGEKEKKELGYFKNMKKNFTSTWGGGLKKETTPSRKKKRGKRPVHLRKHHGSGVRGARGERLYPLITKNEMKPVLQAFRRAREREK